MINLVFLFLCPMVVGYFAAKGYLDSGSTNLILLGCGVFSLGLGSLIAGFIMTSQGPNAVVTIHNISALLAGLFHILTGEFSHSICRECAKKYYPDMDIYEEIE